MNSTHSESPAIFDPRAVAAEFPLLRQPRTPALHYLDNAATTQKPQCVFDAVAEFYTFRNANVRRGAYGLSEAATRAYEGARSTVARFINADDDEVVFVRGATEAINLVARTYVSSGDAVVVSEMEHHANIVPWQIASQRHLEVIRIDDDGDIDMDDLGVKLSSRPKILAISWVSNVLGTENPVREIVEMAHEVGVPVLLDAAQASPHLKIDVKDVGADFVAFSGHKMYGPMGIGVLYGQRRALSLLPPFQGGGDMIDTVTFERTTFAQPPHRFEAGTPNAGGAVGLAEAARYMLRTGGMAEHEDALAELAREKLVSVQGVTLLSNPRRRVPVIPFTLNGAHPHDVATILDSYGVCVRAGHHCAQPLMRRLGLNACLRASFAGYNTTDDLDALVNGLESAREILCR